ncbi:F-box protein [Parachlamydia acanthamoebae]|uniref:F-box protein n=1 Tax=Parachlamydia acanthamoebae TaxID=83552 RepID=UPI000750FC92|nr:F-box protein [Parachlamydia acanthamoebae]
MNNITSSQDALSIRSEGATRETSILDETKTFKTSINDLPVEVIQHILLFSRESLPHTSLVNREWHAISMDTLPIINQINNKEIAFFIDVLSKELKSEKNIKTLANIIAVSTGIFFEYNEDLSLEILSGRSGEKILLKSYYNNNKFIRQVADEIQKLPPESDSNEFQIAFSRLKGLSSLFDPILKQFEVEKKEINKFVSLLQEAFGKKTEIAEMYKKYLSDVNDQLIGSARNKKFIRDAAKMLINADLTKSNFQSLYALLKSENFSNQFDTLSYVTTICLHLYSLCDSELEKVLHSLGNDCSISNSLAIELAIKIVKRLNKSKKTQRTYNDEIKSDYKSVITNRLKNLKNFNDLALVLNGIYSKKNKCIFVEAIVDIYNDRKNITSTSIPDTLSRNWHRLFENNGEFLTVFQLIKTMKTEAKDPTILSVATYLASIDLLDEIEDILNLASEIKPPPEDFSPWAHQLKNTVLYQVAKILHERKQPEKALEFAKKISEEDLRKEAIKLVKERKSVIKKVKGLFKKNN